MRKFLTRPMTRKSFPSMLALVLVLVLLVFGSAVVLAEGRPLSATLTGEAEVPGPGDPNGSGTANITLNQGQRRVCFEIVVSDITLPATAAHIHVGSADVAGPVVVPLAPPDASGTSSGCVSDVDRDLIKAIRQNPSAYYVNVHTTDFPAGAVRGQLSK